MSLSQSEILNTLTKLNIDQSTKQNGDWLFIRCPFHLRILGKPDKKIGNCSINLQTSVIHCFACHHSENLLTLVQEKLNLNYTDAFEYVTGRKLYKNNGNRKFEVTKCDFKLNKHKNDYKNKNKQKEENNINYLNSKNLISFNPESYYYTKQRGFTSEFCNQFGIKKCISGYYNEYFIIPIVDNKKKIFTFEARKLLQYELDHKAELTGLEKEYLANKKVLYPKGSSVIKKTLFNIDNLDFEKDLWISEGIGTIPKVYLNVSKNVTCTFGSEISNEQIEYLKLFKGKKIWIPDQDETALLTIESLNTLVQNLCVVSIKTEDTDDNFVQDIKDAPIIEASRYLLNQYNVIPTIEV